MTRELSLQPRLALLASLVPQGAVLADVGTDHGYIPVCLRQRGVIDRAIASDIGREPLEHARRTAEEYGVGGIDLRLCAGLDAIAPEECDTVLIAGMGGETIWGILAAAPWTRDGRHTLLLQPQTKIEELRLRLCENGYAVTREHLVRDKGKLYVVMTVTAGERYSPGAEQLYGEVSAGGAKNAAVAIIPATVLARGRCVLENVPDIHDTELLFSMLRAMGATVEKLSRTSAIIDTSTLTESTVPYELSKHMRASYYFIGSLLGRFGQACVSMPGGCNFGVRPIDQHIKGFEAMGAMVEQAGGYVCADAPKGGLRGGHVYLDIVSVGATMNILLAAVLCSGMTIIENCAKEPHIVDLANFLNAMGAQISGAGTDVIKVRGVRALHGGSYSIIPDQIEAGTYMACLL